MFRTPADPQYTYPDLEDKKIELMNYVYGVDINGQKIPHGIVLGIDLALPIMDDCAGSAAALESIQINNPNIWQQSIRTFLVLSLPNSTYHICAVRDLNKIEENDDTGYIFFDQATSNSKIILSMLAKCGINMEVKK